jgi:hypothetical protein
VAAVCAASALYGQLALSDGAAGKDPLEILMDFRDPLETP